MRWYTCLVALAVCALCACVAACVLDAGVLLLQGVAVEYLGSLTDCE